MMRSDVSIIVNLVIGVQTTINVNVSGYTLINLLKYFCWHKLTYYYYNILMKTNINDVVIIDCSKSVHNFGSI